MPGRVREMRWRTTPASLTLLLCAMMFGSRYSLAQASQQAESASRIELPRPRVDVATSTTNRRRRPDVINVPGPGQPVGLRVRKSARSSVSFDVGDTLSFNVPMLLMGTWSPEQFTLRAESDSLRLWVATSEFAAGDVTQSNVDDLMLSLRTSTPSSSYDPSSGIVAIETAVFGDVANYDGDGVVDILWYDVADDYSGPGTAFTPVAVSGVDVDPSRPPSEGNQADIIYLDTFPTLNGPGRGIEFVRTTVSSGYQSLIHLNYDQDEITFLRVGQFEWAAILTGHAAPATSYLLDFIEHNIALLSFDGFVGDRERGALFIQYIVDQLGPEYAGVLMRDTANADVGLGNMLTASGDPRSLATFVADFHTANLVNDKSVAPSLGYADPRLASVGIVPTLSIDASLESGLAPAMVTMQPGGVQYIQWENVRDLEVVVDAVDSENRDMLAVRAVTQRPSGDVTVEEIELDGSAHLIGGSSDLVTVVIVHQDLTTGPFGVRASADWAGTAYATTNVIRDSGQFHAPEANFVTLGPGWSQAVKFEPPPGHALSKLFVPVIFQNQFIEPGTNQFYGSPSDPRDFSLHVLRGDIEGLPGDTLFSRTFALSTPYEPVAGSSVRFTELALDVPGLAAGEPIVYVSITEAGTDDNNLILGLSDYADADVSYLHGPINPPTSSWFALWDLQIGGMDLTGATIPIRAQFKSTQPVGVARQLNRTEKTRITAAYPNPTTGRTSIEFETVSPGRHDVEVFDVVGRLVSGKSMSVVSRGSDRINLDLSALPSGVYFARVRSEKGGYSRSSRLVVAR